MKFFFSVFLTTNLSISQIQTSINSRFSIQNKNTFGSAAASDLCGLVGMFMDDISIDWEVCEDVKNYRQIISQIF